VTYHRLESPTQTSTDAQRQQATGEIWGKAASFSNLPAVKAYQGPLPAGARGIEFTTSTAPTPGTSTPTVAYWHIGTPGVRTLTSGGIQFAVISATITKVTQVP
jgi:hypothetical protein